MAPSENGELDLVNSSDAARMFGVTRQRINQLMHGTEPEFPRPAYSGPGVILWHRSDILEWGRRAGYVIDY